jgi:hypothetical protein
LSISTAIFSVPFLPQSREEGGVPPGWRQVCTSL